MSESSGLVFYQSFLTQFIARVLGLEGHPNPEDFLKRPPYHNSTGREKWESAWRELAKVEACKNILTLKYMADRLFYLLDQCDFICHDSITENYMLVRELVVAMRSSAIESSFESVQLAKNRFLIKFWLKGQAQMNQKICTLGPGGELNPKEFVEILLNLWAGSNPNGTNAHHLTRDHAKGKLFSLLESTIKKLREEAWQNFDSAVAAGFVSGGVIRLVHADRVLVVRPDNVFSYEQRFFHSTKLPRPADELFARMTSNQTLAAAVMKIREGHMQAILFINETTQKILYLVSPLLYDQIIVVSGPGQPLNI